VATEPSSAPDPSDTEVAVFALFDVAPAARLWGWSRMAFGRAALMRARGVRFAKMLGAGADGGFSLARPSASIQGAFCVLADDAAAAAFVADDGPLAPWRARSREWLSMRLRACSSRGSWSGMRLSASVPLPAYGPVASLTRASIRPARAAAFWRMQPAAERALAQARGCRLSVGVGEAPVLRQATFTVWDDAAAMDAYARGGAHLEAIRAAAAGAFFSESMFVRFVPFDARGTWRGRALG
jgi:spheroidene monooxygenase